MNTFLLFILALSCPTWMGLSVCEESPLAGYNRGDFGTGYSRLEAEIIRSLPQSNGLVYTPYTCTPFSIRDDGTASTDIEHIVALSEAYASGLAESQFDAFSEDIDNLTVTDPIINRDEKRGYDAGEWKPLLNQGWFAAHVVAVKRKYGLSVDPRERDALQEILDSDPSRSVVCEGG